VRIDRLKVLFLGTGEAFSHEANTSLIIDDRILLDCGPHTLQQLRRIRLPLKQIETVFISHLHADHIFGLPLLLVAATEDEREKPLNILGGPEVEGHLQKLLRLAYQKDFRDLSFPLKIHEATQRLTLEGYRFSFAENQHSIPTLSTAIAHRSRKISYMSDGKHTEEGEKLAQSSHLLVSEAYMEGLDTHSSITEAAKLARKTQSQLLALVHICRREDREEQIKKAESIFQPLILPQPLDVLHL
jgi:ribonuclease BN (tRNA processing enzyme)